MTDTHDEADDFVALLRGDLGRERLGAVVGHLRSCGSCRLSLVEVAAVHGALEAAGRLLGRPTPATPSLSLHDEQLLPPLTLPRRRPASRRLVAGAVAAAVLVGGGSAVALARSGLDRRPVVASVALRPLSGGAGGRVTMSGSAPQVHMTISTSGLPVAGAGRFYFAWLLDPRTQKMLPLGVVGAASERFDVSSDLVRRYHAVDISLESDNGDPAHSVTSVLRATY